MGKKIILFGILIALCVYLNFYTDWQSILKGIFGLLSFVGIAYLFSENKAAISWNLILKGIIAQILIAILILKTSFLGRIFEIMSQNFIEIMSYAQKGTNFLCASFISGKIESPLINFTIMVLPTIIFFSALTSILYYLKIIPKIVSFLAFIMAKTLKISGVESMFLAGSIFLGPPESALLVKNYLKYFNKSSFMLLMTSGMATISGSVMASFIYYLGGDNSMEQAIFAKHLMTASLMSAPAAVIMARLIIPQHTENIEKQEKRIIELTEHENTNPENILSAILQGTTDGLKIAVGVASILLVFIALLGLINDFILTGIIGKYTGLNDIIAEHTSYVGLSLEFIFGYALAPFAYLMGIAWEDIFLVGQLLGEKTLINEFIAYNSLGKMKQADLFFEKKSIIIATYALCGFSNFASIGMQVASIGAMIPEKKALLGQLGFKALLAATLACIMTGIIAGMVV